MSCLVVLTEEKVHYKEPEPLRIPAPPGLTHRVALLIEHGLRPLNNGPVTYNHKRIINQQIRTCQFWPDTGLSFRGPTAYLDLPS